VKPGATSAWSNLMRRRSAAVSSLDEPKTACCSEPRLVQNVTVRKSPSSERPLPVPRWASAARAAFRVLVGIWAIVYALGALLWLAVKVFDVDIGVPEISTGPVFGVFVGFAVVAGLLWLVGEGVAGLKDKERDFPA
jgi:hypothetical protein